MTLLNKLPKVRGEYRENAALSQLCWLGIGGLAEILYTPVDSDDLANFFANKLPDIPVFILGIGSNVLVRDGGIDGVIIKLGTAFSNIEFSKSEDGAYGYIIAGAAALDKKVSIFALQHSLSGLEFMMGIPGTIGGAIAMNAGCYKDDVSKVIEKVTAISSLTGEIRNFSRDEISFIYRGNNLSKEWVFIDAHFKCCSRALSRIVSKMNRIQEQRIQTQPAGVRTCGSTFKNPNGHKAWELIKDAGCSGMRIGGAEFSQMHCNFIVNVDNAISSDVERLIDIAIEKVKEHCGIVLCRELIVIGKNKGEYSDV